MKPATMYDLAVTKRTVDALRQRVSAVRYVTEAPGACCVTVRLPVGAGDIGHASALGRGHGRGPISADAVMTASAGASGAN